MSRDLDSIIDEALSVKEEKIDITYRVLMEMMESELKNVLSEAAGRGVQLEWAMVYWALKQAASKSEFSKRIRQQPKLKMYGEGEMGPQGKSAVSVATKSGAPIKLAFHSDEKNIQGDPEPKTDLLFGDHRVSVKMSGGIQLTSSEGRRTAKMFKIVLDEMLEENPKFKNSLEKKVLEGIISRVENIPNKMIDPKNLQKALLKKPKQANAMMKNGELLNEFNWKVWEEKNKRAITNDIVSFLESNKEFRFKLIEETMTGKRAFGADNLATATHIATPSYYGPIDTNYIKKIANATKIQVRAKSRSGITSATVRFDVTAASAKAALKVDEGITDDVRKLLTQMAPTAALNKIKQFKKSAISWLAKFKGIVRSWFVKNIDRVVSDAVGNLDFSIEDS